MTRTADLRALTVQALLNQTDAGAKVFAALTWPTWDGSYPLIYIQAPLEDKSSLGPNGAPQFTVTTTMRISARVQGPAKPNNVGAAEIELALERFQEQIEIALINYTPLMSILQQFPFVRIEKIVSSEGAMNQGELVMQVGMEFYQGPEDFYPIPTFDLERVTLDADLAAPFDPSGTYPNPPFPDAVVPAPRTSGPDGRAEGGFDITLPP